MYTDNKGNKWYKGNLHTHTTISDGRLDIKESIGLYKDNGYDFIAVTDHWKWNFLTFDMGITVIPGCEYDFGSTCGKDIYHIVAIDCKGEPCIERSSTPQEAIDAIHSCGGICNLAHPAWSLNSPEDLMKLKNVDMTEIYNSASGVPWNCRPYSGVILDTMAARGHMWNLCATDDTHFYGKEDSCRSFVYVNSTSEKREHIVNALKEGKYYASQGPQILVEIKDGKVIVETTPVCQIVFFTGKAYVKDRCVVGNDITYGEYTVKKDDGFVRVEVKDKDGNRAWSQYCKL
ncbi:MAG: hypothetical protein IKJ68_03930 [Clostridia bacterium]|nr:hypothetical protein [Clostridia bacterium]